MRKFEIWVEGDNCLVDVEGKVTKLGFITTRIIKSSNQEEAIAKLRDVISRELEDIVVNDKQDPPNIYIKEISEVSWFKDYFIEQKGFTWYPEDAGP